MEEDGVSCSNEDTVSSAPLGPLLTYSEPSAL